MFFFFYFGRHEDTWNNRLLFVWTKAAVMLDWGKRKSCGITSTEIDLCFILLYDFVCCPVLVLAVLTDGRWKLAATYCNTIICHHMAERNRTFYTLQNAGQQHCKHHSDIGQQVSSLPLIALEVMTVCVLKIGFVKHNLLLWFCGCVYLTSVSVDSLHYIT